MSFDALSSELERRTNNSGLVFDADGVAVIAKYRDELAAYRARRRWVDVLHRYFLLEKARDYELSILAVAENNYFVLNCFFISACGRYAFWRLVNEQAPEAEHQLAQTCLGNQLGSVDSAAEEVFLDRSVPWVLGSHDQTMPRRTRKMTDKLFVFLQGILR